MNEFQTKKGGRKLYNEDFYNLQEIIESNTALFKSIGGNFVISGCQQDSNGNIEGYVFLDNKIRKLEKTNISNMITPAIIPYDTSITDVYEDGNQSPIIYNYGCKVIDLSKTSTVTSKITCGSDKKFNNIFESFISNFIVLKDSNNTQYVQNSVEFSDIVELANTMLKKSGIKSTMSRLDNGSIKISIQNHWIIITPDGDITFNFKENEGNNDVKAFSLTNKENKGKLNMYDASFYKLKAQTVKVKSINNFINTDKIENINNSLLSTDWYNIIDKSNGQKLTDMCCCVRNGFVYIQGSIPALFCHKSKLSDYQNLKISDYGLPDEIPLPENDVEFDVMSPQTGGIGVTVHIMKNEPYAGRFYFDSNAFPANDSTVIKGKWEFGYNYPVCIAWQYAANFNYKSIYKVSVKEDFFAYTYNSNSSKFIAYNRIIYNITNNKTGSSYKNIIWKEAEFVGSVHQGDSPGNYCSTYKNKNSDGTYDTGCATGTLYFRSSLNPQKLYNQTWFSGDNPIIAGVKKKLGYDSYVTIQKASDSFQVNDNSLHSFTPSTDKIIIHCGYKELKTIVKDATNDTPPLYFDAIETARDFTITSGNNILTLLTSTNTGDKVYSVSDFQGAKQITISFPDKTFTFKIQRL